MKISLAWIQSGQVKQYSLDYTGDELRINEVRDVLRQAKNNFKIPGRQYIMVAGNRTYYLVKVRKDWDVYQIGVDLREQIT